MLDLVMLCLTCLFSNLRVAAHWKCGTSHAAYIDTAVTGCVLFSHSAETMHWHTVPGYVFCWGDSRSTHLYVTDLNTLTLLKHCYRGLFSPCMLLCSLFVLRLLLLSPARAAHKKPSAGSAVVHRPAVAWCAQAEPEV